MQGDSSKPEKAMTDEQSQPRRCEFVLEIEPEGWRRARVMRVGRGVRHFTDAKTRAYETAVGFAAQCAMAGQPLLEGAVSAVMVFSMPIPASWPNRKAVAARLGEIRPTVAPDVDNLTKAILDGCNEVVFHDDRQVVYLEATKRYADRPGVAVSFEELRT